MLVTLVEPDVVKEKELQFGPPIRGIRNRYGLEIRLGLLRDVPWVPRVHLSGHRVHDVADQHHRRLSSEGVHGRRGRIRDQKHVRLVNLLEAPDGGAIEPDSVGEKLLSQLAYWNGEVLPQTR